MMGLLFWVIYKKLALGRTKEYYKFSATLTQKGATKMNRYNPDALGFTPYPGPYPADDYHIEEDLAVIKETVALRERARRRGESALAAAESLRVDPTKLVRGLAAPPMHECVEFAR